MPRRADAPPNRFYAYGVVARLAALAASVEIGETAPAEKRTPVETPWQPEVSRRLRRNRHEPVMNP